MVADRRRSSWQLPSLLRSQFGFSKVRLGGVDVARDGCSREGRSLEAAQSSDAAKELSVLRLERDMKRKAGEARKRWAVHGLRIR